MKLFIYFLFALLLNAQIIDRVVAVVDNTPITSYEVESVKKRLNISSKDALEILINQKLIENEIKKRGIFVDDYDVEMYIENIASQQGMTPYELKSYLRSKGKYQEFFDNLKKELAKKRLFEDIVKNEISVDEKKLKEFYEKNREKYAVFEKIKVREYVASNPQMLKSMMFAPLKEYSFKELPLNLLIILKNTPEGRFTPVIEDGLNYKRYYVEKKEGKAYIPLDKIKNLVMSDYMNYQREKILKDYFSKLKNQADIKIYN